MAELVRMSFSIEEGLYKQLERLVKESRYTNRSEFVRDLIREQLVKDQWKENADALGTVTLVYNHHKRQLGEKLTKVQHHHHQEILAATHVHLNDDLCAEVVIIRGHASAIRHIADELRQQKGVLHATLSMSTTGQDLG